MRADKVYALPRVDGFVLRLPSGEGRINYVLNTISEQTYILAFFTALAIRQAALQESSRLGRLLRYVYSRLKHSNPSI